MEQKEKLKQIFRLSRFLPVSLGAVSAALLVRILQLNLAVDFATGFFQEDTFLVPLLTVILLLYLAYAVIVLLLHPLRLEQPYKMKNPLPAAVILARPGSSCCWRGSLPCLVQTVCWSGLPLCWRLLLEPYCFIMRSCFGKKSKNGFKTMFFSWFRHSGQFLSWFVFLFIIQRWQTFRPIFLRFCFQQRLFCFWSIMRVIPPDFCGGIRNGS